MHHITTTAAAALLASSTKFSVQTTNERFYDPCRFMKLNFVGLAQMPIYRPSLARPKVRSGQPWKAAPGPCNIRWQCCSTVTKLSLIITCTVSVWCSW